MHQSVPAGWAGSSSLQSACLVTVDREETGSAGPGTRAAVTEASSQHSTWTGARVGLGRGGQQSVCSPAARSPWWGRGWRPSPPPSWRPPAGRGSRCWAGGRGWPGPGWTLSACPRGDRGSSQAAPAGSVDIVVDTVATVDTVDIMHCTWSMMPSISSRK